MFIAAYYAHLALWLSWWSNSDLFRNPTEVRDFFSFSVWAHFLSKAIAQKQLSSIFFPRFNTFSTFKSLYMFQSVSADQPNLTKYPSHATLLARVFVLGTPTSNPCIFSAPEVKRAVFCHWRSRNSSIVSCSI